MPQMHHSNHRSHPGKWEGCAKMTVDTLEYDENLESHAVIEIKSVRQAITSYPASDVNESEGERKHYTGREYNVTKCVGLHPLNPGT
jgi:hypothetical protein